MAVSLKHAFASAKADSADASLVNASNWNAEHTLTLATDKLLGRVSTGTGAAEEVTFTDFAQSLLDDVDAATARTTLGAAASGANTDITSVYLDNTGLKVKDTNASHGLTIAPGSDLTADRTLTITTGDAARTLDISAGSVTISTAGAALIDDANAAAQRTTLGLVIGTDVQAYDAELAALAGLSSAANTVPAFTGSGTAGLVTLAASQLVGRGSTGNVTNIALGSGLSMSGATLSASGGTSAMVAALSTTSGTTVSQTGISSYAGFIIQLMEVSHNHGSSQSIRVEISTDNGSTYGTAIDITSSQSSGVLFSGIGTISHANATANKRIVAITLANTLTGTETVKTGTINALRFSPSGGNFDAGEIIIWGVG